MAEPQNGKKMEERLELFHREMTDALRENLRNHSHCQLVVVTKRHPLSVVREAYQCGERHFGESQVQEGVPKVKALPKDAIWHFIGHLQKNKVRKVLQHFSYLHSVDTLDLLERIERIASEESVRPKVFLQVNLLGVAGRFGFLREEMDLVLEKALGMQSFDCVGLMGMRPLAADTTDRAFFEGLAGLRNELKEKFPDWPGLLSMGMSNDFLDAIAMGSNFLRIGTRIVGERT